MRKILMLFMLTFGVFGYSNAQICKISDNGDNVEVFSAFIKDGNTVIVTVGNDSKEMSANVTVKVEVTYDNNYNHKVTRSFTGKCLAKPNQESVITISIPEVDESQRKPVSVKVTNISGTKCA